MYTRQFSAIAFAAVLVATSVALAQTPQRTTATYEDWVLRCENQDSGKLCEIVQATQVQGNPNPVSQVAIGKPNKTEPLKIAFQVPVNVWLPTGIRLVVDDKDPGIAAAFKRCIGAACLADTDLKDDALKKLRAQHENGKLLFKDATQKDVALPVSFKGFVAAFDAMTKQ
ncbi:MAG TPA: invasion associated locus B family protein [Xanthobacteraceae bacterium]|nr:invasion associated locus B family protein [Xanthobacteraceae bacterium]